MKQFYQRIVNWGTEFSRTSQDETNIYYANSLLIFFFALTLVIGILVWIRYGWFIVAPSCFAISLLYLVFLWFNKLGWHQVTRVIISIFLPTVTVVLSVMAKQSKVGIEPYEYFVYRFFLLVSPFIPISVYRVRNNPIVYFGLIPSFLYLILYDPIHSTFGVGYFQMGFTSPNYDFTNYVAIMVYILFVRGMISFKSLTEKLQDEKVELINELSKANQSLMDSNSEIGEKAAEIQLKNEEIQMQSEQLAASHKKLLKANKIVQQHADYLADSNKELKNELKENYYELLHSNKELIYRNQDLIEF
jgi:hypothetical protein